MPTRILLIRHAQTEWNVVDRFRGRADIDLNEAGRKQAQALAGRLAEMTPAAIYSSPMKRAIRTAEPVAALTGIPVTAVPELNDVDYGDWQGLNLEQAEHNDPDAFAVWRDAPGLARFPHGESLEEVRQRAANAVGELLPYYEDSTLVVVSHITVCRLLTLHFLNVATARFWSVTQDNCGISIFEPRANLFVALSINDTCHLKKG